LYTGGDTPASAGGRTVALDQKLPAILEGKEKPVNDAERLALAWLCQQPFKKRYAASARLYAEALANDARLADNLQQQYRFNAACAAALAGCGQGKDAEALGEEERPRLRRQALEWLRADDLAAYRRLLEKEADMFGPAVRNRMQGWQQAADFAGVRGPEALAKLPEAERQAWHKLWADVADLLARAEGKGAPKEKSPMKEPPPQRRPNE
jgi:hypothetical protein